MACIWIIEIFAFCVVLSTLVGVDALQSSIPYDLIVYQQPGSTTGGEPCSPQPVIRAKDATGNWVVNGSKGLYRGYVRTSNDLLTRVATVINKNPVGIARVYQRNKTTQETRSIRMPDAFFYVAPDGIIQANFSGVYINEIGMGYTLHFITYDAIGKATYQRESEKFNVNLGPLYKISIIQPSGTMTGGMPFRPNPKLATVDRGNNVQIHDQTTSFRVEMIYGPGLLSTSVKGDYNHTVVNGVASFLGLNFNKKGYPYKLRYFTDAPIFPNFVDSINLTVGVGHADYMSIIIPPDGARGGIPFVYQPCIIVKDRGGNILIDDDHSTITANIENNPGLGTLKSVIPISGPFKQYRMRNDAENTWTLVPHTIQLEDGAVNYTGMSIDKVAREYTLRFLIRADVGNYYGWTGSFYLDSPTFDVTHGDPTNLRIMRAPADAWAGGSPFRIQPEVAIVDAGENIMTPDSTSTITVAMTKSPSGFPLLGYKTMKVSLGRCLYNDLQINKASKGYILTWYTSAGNFNISYSLDVVQSTEWEMVQDDRQPGDKMGWSAGVYDNLAVVGAIGEDRPIDEVQVVTTTGTERTLTREVQLVTTTATWRSEVQSLLFTCTKGTSIKRIYDASGADSITQFRIKWKNKMTRMLELGAPGDNFADYIEDDIPEIKQLKVSGHDTEIKTGCGGSMEYRVTFVGSKGEVEQLTVESVTYTSETINGTVKVNTVIPAVQISGYFQLYMPKTFHEGHTGPVVQESTTDLLPYNISADGMERAIEAMWTPKGKVYPVDVTREGPDFERGFTWRITFHAPPDFYNPPQMLVGGFPDFQAYPPGVYSPSKSLFGYEARAYVRTLVQGTGPLFGTFRLAFRGYDEHTTLTQSEPINFNASASEMESKLEGIGTINNVEVQRSGPDVTNGYAWTITFKTSTGKREGWDAVRYVSPHSLRQDNVGNLRAMVPDNSKLAGTGRNVKVSYLYNTSKHPPWEAKRLGNAGDEAGAAYVYHRSGSRWIQEFKLRAHNTDSFDHFGYDSAMWKHTIAVSAPHAEDLGHPESQSFVCSADRGQFTLTFRNHTTEPLSHNLTASELETHLESLESIIDVDVSIWANASKLGVHGKVCTNYSVDDKRSNSVLITFHYPMDGDLPALRADVSHADDVSPTQAPPVRSLIGWARLLRGNKFGNVVVTDDVVKGSATLGGKDARGINSGVVYIFHRDNATSEFSTWTQEARISAPDFRVGGAEFGYSIALIGPDDAIESHDKERKKEYTLIIGSPEDDTMGDGAGMVYVYRSREQCLDPCIFGSCCKREWYLFQNISFKQMICGLSATAPALPFKCPLNDVEKLPPRRFGHSVSATKATLAIGEAPHHKLIKKNQNGVAYVLRRANPFSTTDIYVPDQVLYAWDREDPVSPEKGGDEFGTSVSVSGEFLTVGAPGKYGADKGGLYQGGAVYVFKRATIRHAFMPDQILHSTERGVGFRFGRQVRVHNGVVLATAHINHKGKSSTTNEVQEIYVAGHRNGPKSSLGGWWSIGWQFRQSIRKPTLASSGMFSWTSFNKKNKPFTGTSLDFLEIGTLVEAERSGSEKLFPGKVIRKNTDDTYTVVFRDGHYEEYLQRYQLRPIDREIQTRDHRTKNELTKTEMLPHNILASELREIMMEQLGTGLITVSRSHVDYQGGYTWTVTFLRKGNVPSLIPRSALTGVGGHVGQRTVREPTERATGAAYMFTRLPHADVVASPIATPNPWVEQCMFHPKLEQDADMFGFSGLALRLPTAIVGAPNRDQFVSYANSGVGYAFDLQFMDFQFEKKVINSLESVTRLPVQVLRCRNGCKFSKSLDESHFETVVGDGADSGLYPIRIGGDNVNGANLCQDKRGCASSAKGRRDCRVLSAGSNECYFVKSNAILTEESHYDSRGRSDYAPDYKSVELLKNAVAYAFNVTVTNDFLYEYPDEILNVRITSPGMEPSYGGNLWAVVNIENDGDGAYGTRGYSEKLFANPTKDQRFHIHNDAKYGFTLSIEDSILAVSAPHADVFNGTTKTLYAGVVVIHRRISGVWIKDATISSPKPFHGGHFGEAVSLDSKKYSINGQEKKLPVLLVSAPGQAKAYVFQRKGQKTDGTGNWVLEDGGILGHAEAARPDHGFGGENAIDIYHNTVAIGARGCERVFMFYRTNHFLSEQDASINGTWKITQVLQASQYKQRTLIDDSLAVVNFDADRLKTPPHYTKQSVIYITAAEFGASVALEDDTLVVGSPQAGYQGEVNLNADGTFDQDVHYTGTGAVFIFGWVGNYTDRGESGSWQEHSALFAPDKMAADRFGHSVALSKDTVVIGAPGDELKPQSTWDFETGDLVGWTKTGNAFDFQPTLGDNSYQRYVYGYTIPIKNMYGDRTGLEGDELRTALFHYYGGDPQRSNHIGKYWIGTFENRHKNTTHPGTEQGDRPQGTLESEVFQIRGDTISFMIGGGCEITEEYVELLVDGEGAYMATSITSQSQKWGRHADDTTSNLWTVLRATGKCSEEMERVTWNVRKWIGRSARIRVVDRSSSKWAHINFDDVRFSWHNSENHRVKNEGAGTTPGCHRGQCGTNAGQNAGAAYVFRRRDRFRHVVRNTLNMYEGCEIDCDAFGCYTRTNPNRYSCEWEYSQKLQPSDRRPGQHFGYTVAFDDQTGTAAVGSRFSRTVDFYNRDSGDTWWHTLDTQFSGGKADSASGAVYVFSREAEYRSGQGALLKEPTFNITEHAKLQPWDAHEYMLFGATTGIGVNGWSIAVGAPGDATGGSVYVLDTEFQKFRVRQKVFSADEGAFQSFSFVEVKVIREGDLSGTAHIGYATSDITAIGVNADIFYKCQKYFNYERRPQVCGDYLMTAGELTFGPTEFDKTIRVEIMDDWCHERWGEFFRVQLFLVGGPPLIGEKYDTVVRIDDDDLSHVYNIKNLDYCRKTTDEIPGSIVAGASLRL
jgi:hypothetical protein